MPSHPLGERLELRAETAADEPFLYQLYAGTRAETWTCSSLSTVAVT